jgi:ubiquinone/menaquinone biosynthesis C-methylase UbiE
MVCQTCKCKYIKRSFLIRDYEYNFNTVSEYSICKKCNLIYRTQNIKDEEAKLLYSEKIYMPVKGGLLYNYLKYINAYYEKYSILKRILKKQYKEKTIVLDIACGKGYLLELFAKYKKYICFGVDINFIPDRSNIKFISSDFKNLNIIKSINADIIIINNFIEHIEDMNDLYKIIKVMKKGSNMIIITPDTDSNARLFFSTFWSGYHAPRHKMLFNKKNILKTFSHIKDINLRTYKLFDPFTNLISYYNLIKEFRVNFSIKLLLKVIITPSLLLMDLFKKNRILMIIQKK